MESGSFESPAVGIGGGLFGYEARNWIARGEYFDAVELLGLEFGEGAEGGGDFQKNGWIRAEKTNLDPVRGGQRQEGDFEKAAFLCALDDLFDGDLCRRLVGGLAYWKLEAGEPGFGGGGRSGQQQQKSEERSSRPGGESRFIGHGVQARACSRPNAPQFGKEHARPYQQKSHKRDMQKSIRRFERFNG